MLLHEMRVQRNSFCMVLDEFTAVSSPNLNINYFYSMIFQQKSYYNQDWKTQNKYEEASVWKLPLIVIIYR